jgi:hypothetical protein
MPYHKRPDRIRDPAAILEAMRPCREALLHEQAELKPFGVHYNGLSTVIAAIDAVATLLGHSEHYWSHGSAPRPQWPPD